MVEVRWSKDIPKGKDPEFLFRADWQMEIGVRILWILSLAALGIKFLQAWQ